MRKKKSDWNPKYHTHPKRPVRSAELDTMAREIQKAVGMTREVVIIGHNKVRLPKKR